MIHMQQYRNLAIGIVVIVAILGGFALFQSDVLGERAARNVVTSFGAQLKNIPLSGEPEIARQAIEEKYAEFVSLELLEQWKKIPAGAPGRLTSSPWPERIEITEIVSQGNGYVVSGNVIYMTSVEETQGGIARSQPVVILVVRNNDGWRIAAYQEKQTQEPQD